jgi:cytoskeletal protein RodZ
VESVESNADAAAARTLGQTLASERERQGLSRSDAAQRLHMSAYQIEAIETGDYARLPKGTFLRGFVRNYAKILGLRAEEALALLPEHAPRDQKPGIVVPTQNIRFDPLGDRLQTGYSDRGPGPRTKQTSSRQSSRADGRVLQSRASLADMLFPSLAFMRKSIR